MYRYFPYMYILPLWIVYDQNDKGLRMRKPTICIGENKGADQLRSNCEADQCLCFCYTDSTISHPIESEISSI